MAGRGEDRRQQGRVRPQAAGSSKSGATMGGGGQERAITPAAPQPQAGRRTWHHGFRQMDTGAQAQRQVQVAGHQQVQAPVPADEAQTPAQRLTAADVAIAQNDQAARRQCPGGGQGIGQAGVVGNQDQPAQIVMSGQLC